MRKIIVTEFMSLDGVIENPMWTFPYWNDAIAGFKTEESSSGEHLLLGRVTYEGFAQVWPNSDDAGAAYFNSTRKYVMSNTLSALPWNNSVQIKGDLKAEISKLKQEDGPNLVVHGSAKLANSLLQNGLVDQIRLLVYPLVLGKGERMFQDGTTVSLKLVASKDMGGGVVSFVYEPEKQA